MSPAEITERVEEFQNVSRIRSPKRWLNLRMEIFALSIDTEKRLMAGAEMVMRDLAGDEYSEKTKGVAEFWLELKAANDLLTAALDVPDGERDDLLVFAAQKIFDALPDEPPPVFDGVDDNPVTLALTAGIRYKEDA